MPATCEPVACTTTGESQSPIPLEPSQSSALAAPVTRYGTHVALIAYNSGYGLRADLPAADLLLPSRTNTLQVDGGTYQLLEFHFHAPGEHVWPGNVRPALELHLVHADARGNLAVLGVPIVVRPGSSNVGFEQLLQQAPAQRGQRRSLPAFFNLAQFVAPALGGATFRYPGSLTTPPCSEGVRWNLTDMSRALVIAPTQETRYRAVFPQSSCRPLQPLNGRVPLRVAP
jgi:carbonic anhydrase